MKTHIANGVDVDVVLGTLGMRHEGLNEELSQDALCVLNLLCLASPRGNPGLGLGPCLVEGQQTALTPALDKLVGLRDELQAGSKEPGVGDLSLVEHTVDVCVLCKVERCKSGRGVVLRLRGERAGLDDRSAGEVVVEDGLAIGLEDCLRRHGVVSRASLVCVRGKFSFVFLVSTFQSTSLVSALLFPLRIGNSSSKWEKKLVGGQLLSGCAMPKSMGNPVMVYAYLRILQKCKGSFLFVLLFCEKESQKSELSIEMRKRMGDGGDEALPTPFKKIAGMEGEAPKRRSSPASRTWSIACCVEGGDPPKSFWGWGERLCTNAQLFFGAKFETRYRYFRHSVELVHIPLTKLLLEGSFSHRIYFLSLGSSSEALQLQQEVLE